MSWGGRRAQRIRASWRPLVEAASVVCHLCGRLIFPGESWDLDHREPRAYGGDDWDEENIRPAHARCNRRAGQRIGMRNRRRRPKPGIY